MVLHFESLSTQPYQDMHSAEVGFRSKGLDVCIFTGNHLFAPIFRVITLEKTMQQTVTVY